MNAVLKYQLILQTRDFFFLAKVTLLCLEELRRLLFETKDDFLAGLELLLVSTESTRLSTLTGSTLTGSTSTGSTSTSSSFTASSALPGSGVSMFKLKCA